MGVVSSAVCGPLVLELRARGLDDDRLVEGLPCTIADLESRFRSIDWECFRILLERSAKLFGGVEALEDLAFRHAAHQMPRLMRKVVPRLSGPRPIYMIGARWLGPWVFRATRATCEELADGRLRQRVETMAPHRPSPEFHWVTRGILRAGPQLLGLPPAIVELRDEGHEAEYLITLPPARRRFPWSRRGLGLQAPPEELAELGFRQEQLRESLRRTQTANEALSRTTRRLESLNRLSREVAQATDFSSIAARVLDVLRASHAVHGVRLLARDPESDEVRRVAEAGEPTGDADRRIGLRAQDREVGRLDLWGARLGDDDQEALLQSLIPWVSIAVANARALDLLSHQATRLQEEIGERRRTEHELDQAQRLDALGRLAGGLAHDMNNLITGVLGYATLAGDALPDDSPVQEDLQEIRTSCDRAASLLHQILAFSRRQVFVPRAVELGSLVRELLPMLHQLVGDGIELVIDAGEEPRYALADRGQLEQAVVNLVTNARDAIGSHGTIRIEVDGAPRGGAELRVRDDGCGIDPDVRRRIFEPFFTTKEVGEGTGIGLASVYGMVAQFGGSVDVESAPGEGATFFLRLPGAAPEEVGPQPRIPRLASPGLPREGHYTVLLVEDDESVRRMTRRILEDRGISVIEARNGPDALALCEARREPIDLLLTDVLMPRMDGRDLARLVRSQRPELRGVIAMTGHAESARAEEDSLAPGIHLLRKPFTVDELHATVVGALGELPGESV